MPVLCPVELPPQDAGIVTALPWYREVGTTCRSIIEQLKGGAAHPLAQLRPLQVAPLGNYVYLLFDAGRLVYIGETENLLIRVGRHVSLGKHFDSAQYVTCSTREARKALECRLIRKLRPCLNRNLVNGGGR
jgi:hypothetical protein